MALYDCANKLGSCVYRLGCTVSYEPRETDWRASCGFSAGSSRRKTSEIRLAEWQTKLAKFSLLLESSSVLLGITFQPSYSRAVQSVGLSLVVSDFTHRRERETHTQVVSSIGSWRPRKLKQQKTCALLLPARAASRQQLRVAWTCASPRCPSLSECECLSVGKEWSQPDIEPETSPSPQEKSKPPRHRFLSCLQLLLLDLIIN